MDFMYFNFPGVVCTLSVWFLNLLPNQAWAAKSPLEELSLLLHVFIAGLSPDLSKYLIVFSD